MRKAPAISATAALSLLAAVITLISAPKTVLDAWDLFAGLFKSADVSSRDERPVVDQESPTSERSADPPRAQGRDETGSRSPDVKLVKLAAMSAFGYVREVAVHPHRPLLAAGGSDSVTMRFWDLHSFQPLDSYKRDLGSVLSLTFSPSGETLAIGCSDGSVRLWSTSSREEIARLPVFQKSGAASLSYSPDGSLLAATSDGVVKVIHVFSGRVIFTRTGVGDAEFGSERHELFVAAHSGLIESWDVRSGVRQAASQTNLGRLRYLSVKAGSVAVMGDEGRFAVANLPSLEIRGVGTHTLDRFALFRGFEISPSGRWLVIATSGNEQALNLWSIDERVTSVASTGSHVDAIAFYPRDDVFVSGSSRDPTYIWSIRPT